VQSARLDAPGPHEVCTWAQLASCPPGQPLPACFLDYLPVERVVRIGNAPPSAEASVEPARGTRDTVFTFLAATDDGDGDPVTATWDFGDGKGAVGERVSHRFGAPATYTVQLTLSDGWDRVAQNLTVVVAREGAGAPQTGVPGPSAMLAVLAWVLGATARSPRLRRGPASRAGPRRAARGARRGR
jgi:hypothetical protein